MTNAESREREVPAGLTYPATTVSMVIPAMNEEANISYVLGRIPDFVDEVILVDGDSIDDTVPLARSLLPDIKVVTQDEPGKGAAVCAGIAAATSDVVIMLDADGSMDPAEAVYFHALHMAGFDVVKGSRFMSGADSTDITLIRRWGNRGLMTLTNLLYRQRFTDLCYGYVSIRRSACQALALEATGFEIEAEIVTKAARAGLRITEVPSFERPRISGVSNLDAFRDGFRILRTLLVSRLGRAARPTRSTEPIPLVVDLTHATTDEVISPTTSTPSPADDARS